jgi:hypothetical protein
MDCGCHTFALASFVPKARSQAAAEHRRPPLDGRSRGRQVVVLERLAAAGAIVNSRT